VDKGRATDVAYLDFCKAFDTVPHNILLSKLDRNGFDGWTLRWMTNRLGGCIQRAVVNGSMSRWRSVTSGVLQGFVLGPVLFNIFINDIAGLSAPSASLLTTPLCGTVDTPEGQGVIQRNLEKLKNLMKYHKAKCGVLHLGWGNPQYQSLHPPACIKSNPEEKNMGVLMDEKLDIRL